MILLLIFVMVIMILYHDFRVSELKTKLSSAKTSVEYIRESEQRFVDRCTRIEEVLDFYANEQNWEYEIIEDVENTFIGESRVELDEGERARKALGYPE